VAHAATCESLRDRRISSTTVTQAESVAAGTTVGNAQVPAYCKVLAISRPSDDSEIQIAIWLPTEGWNGKLLSNGNGGWSGSISPTTLANGLRRGYATAMSDLGHEGGSASFALGHPEKLTDFGYRAADEMTIAAKAVIATYYGRAPKFSYWTGCSAGGRSAMMEAQRYPSDYDGIIAGSPGLNWTGRALLAIWIAQANHTNEDSYIPPSKYPALHQAALDACDAADGLKDGVIEDPTRCHFDPATIQCKGADSPACLTAPQVAAARATYTGPANSRAGWSIAPGFAAGSEMGWATMGGPKPLGLGYDLFRYIVFNDPAWDFRKFDFGGDYFRTMKAGNALLDAINPHLEAFLSHGKLIQYHGWADPQISPYTSIQYFQSVAKAMAGQEQFDASYRLFMVPGMAHCGGGDGASTFDMLTALEQWVEQGKAPDRIPASRVRQGKTDRTRPLCPWPQTAVYKGSGSTDDAANFSCRKLE
jgi:feruloyl esterase